MVDRMRARKQSETKRASLPHFAFHPHLATVRLHDRPADRQSKTGAATGGARNLDKPFEDILEEIPWDARTCVFDRKCYLIATRRCSQLNLSTRLSMANRIGDQVHEDAPDLTLIRPNLG